MYLSIKVDLGGLIEEFGLSNENIRILSSNIIKSITKDFVDGVYSLADRELGGARKAYKDAIQIDTLDYKSREVTLKGWLFNKIESGVSPFDMKEGFRRSSKVRYAKNGNWYLTIPFLFAIPNSTSERPRLPDEVYEVAKKTSQPLKSFQIPESSRLDKLKGDIQGKRSIYEGLQKMNSKEYGTFRRVGAASLESAFIHSGIKPRSFFDRSLSSTEARVPILADNQINQFLIDLGF